MTTTLRPIALHIEEPATGDFAWVLIERQGQQAWTEINRATSAVGTYQEAMAAGLAALQGMVDDLNVGPRQPAGRADDAGNAPVDDADATEPRHRAGAKPFFGFGPAQ